jgi:hypothetical protein
MAATEAIELLRSIDASLKQLVRQLTASQPKAVASDRDLDGPYGNPIVKFMPRDWTGPTYKGQPMSACPAPLLEMLAETFEYFADQADAKNETTDKGKPVSGYKRADAARARGWAQRVRDGRVPVSAGSTQDAGWADRDGDGF